MFVKKFMNEYTKYLNKIVKVIIDRPLGSKHPIHDLVYSLNYGYVPNTSAPDKEEIDAYILGVSEPLTDFTGECIAIIHRLDDDDDKLVIAPKGETYTNEQIKSLTDFQEKYFKSKIVRVK